MILTKQDILEYEDGYKQIQIIAGLIIPMIGLIFFMDMEHIKLSTEKLFTFRIGFLLIFIVFCINILTIYHISVHITKVYNLLAGSDKKYFDHKENIKQAYQYHINKIPVMNFTINLFKISLVLLVISVFLITTSKHSLINSFLYNIMVLACIVTCILILFITVH